MLVYRLPGPATITSARASASQVSGRKRGRSGISETRAMRPPAAEIGGFAAQHAAVGELGDQRHHLARRRQDGAARADARAPRFPRRAESRSSRRRAPSAPGCRAAWPFRAVAGAEPILEDVGDQRRDCRTERARQLRMSPGGIMLNSARSFPELPPSSEVATIATRRSRGARSRSRRRTVEKRTESAQHVRQAGTAAERDDPRRLSAADAGFELAESRVGRRARGYGGRSHDASANRASPSRAPAEARRSNAVRRSVWPSHARRRYVDGSPSMRGSTSRTARR